MSKKPRDPRQMPLNFDASVLVDVERTVCDHHIVTAGVSTTILHGPARAHAGGGATVVSFTDAGTLALRRRAVQRVINAGIFPAPSTKRSPKD